MSHLDLIFSLIGEVEDPTPTPCAFCQCTSLLAASSLRRVQLRTKWKKCSSPPQPPASVRSSFKEVNTYHALDCFGSRKLPQAFPPGSRHLVTAPPSLVSSFAFSAVGLCQEFGLFIPFHLSALELLSKCTDFRTRKLGCKTLGVLNFKGVKTALEESHHEETH